MIRIIITPGEIRQLTPKKAISFQKSSAFYTSGFFLFFLFLISPAGLFKIHWDKGPYLIDEYRVPASYLDLNHKTLIRGDMFQSQNRPKQETTSCKAYYYEDPPPYASSFRRKKWLFDSNSYALSNRRMNLWKKKKHNNKT